MVISQENSDLKGTLKILLVEDDETTVESIKLSMEIFWPKSIIISVDKGSEAILKLKEENYNIVFLDLGLPDIDGVEVLKKIRSFSSVYTVIISARTNQKVIEEVLNLGADDFIVKPFDYNSILKSLETVTNRKS
jgi:two-component system, OmpR family, KDP operon response regulator KdpE